MFSRNSSLQPTLRTRSAAALCAAVMFGVLFALPTAAQEVDGIEHDPGFPHNHVGRTIGGVNSGYRGDPGTYCGPLPRYACGGGSLSQLLFSGQDPFRPQTWIAHRGNSYARQVASKKGHPLQTLVVRAADGSPAANVAVRFYQAGYNRKGIVGRTDADGVFAVAVKKASKNHRFLVEAEGYRRAKLDVLGRDMSTASHQIVLDSAEQRSDTVWAASNAPHRIAVVGDDAVPTDLARDYKKALKAMDEGKWDVAVVELKTLVERWPVGTLETGATYEPRRLLIESLEASGQAALAETLEQRAVVVTNGQVARATG